MTRVALFFLSCLVILSILSQTEAIGRSPHVIPHPDKQCRTASKRAACYGYVHNGDTVDCMDLKCITKHSKGRAADGKFRGVGIGKAVDGTHCNINKVCRNGTCTGLTRGERMPRQYGQNNQIYECY